MYGMFMVIVVVLHVLLCNETEMVPKKKAIRNAVCAARTEVASRTDTRNE